MIFNMSTHRLTCAVGVCDNYHYKTKNLLHEGYPITYHYFPRKIDLCNRWIEACHRNEEFKAEASFICSIHFRPEDFTKPLIDSKLPKRRLKDNVVPTRNLTLDEIMSVTHRNNWKITNGFSYGDDFEVINNSDEANYGSMMNNSDSALDEEFITMQAKI
ncbi:uncharacterized protein [Halyomorpha halys]|uniref:uncharacterized protein n=1 Tax=Halyomorpha halys TaxID=286706 RepID=UPI0034D2E21A